MVLLRPLAVQSSDGRAIRRSGGTRVKTYAAAHALLTGGEPLTMAPDGTSFVTHSMVVDAHHARAMLAAFARSPAAAACAPLAPALPRWAAAVLCALPVPGGNATAADAVHLGFSEYASYAAWVDRHAFQDVLHVDGPAERWSRHPAGGRWAVAASRLADARGRCCPSRRLLAATQRRGWLYAGFEVGHAAPFCPASGES